MLWICQQLQALCLTSHIPFDALMHASETMFQFYKRKLDEEKKVVLKSGVSTAILLVLLDRLRFFHSWGWPIIIIIIYIFFFL